MSLFRDPPTTQYVDTGQGWVGYQVFGDGPKNVLFNSSINHNVEAVWDIPRAAQFFDRLSSFCRVAFFDPRGQGTSDPVPGSGWPTFETFADDTVGVMDAAGFERASVMGDTEDHGRCTPLRRFRSESTL